MASIILSAAGAAIGGGIGLPFGAAIGRALGGTIGGFVDSAIFGSARLKGRDGPRLADLVVQTSTYGKMIPLVYGSTRIAGNVIWSRPIKEVATTTTSSAGGGKGGGGRVSQSTTTYSYFISMAVAICEGPIDEVLRIWADSKQLDLSQGTYRIYKGDETQLPDSFIEGFEGVGSTPAYRGLAYVVVEDFPLADYGNRIPNFTFEVKKKALYPDYQGESVEQMIKSMIMIPGSGEFVYDSQIQYKIPGEQAGGNWVQRGEQERINSHNANGVANAMLSLDQLKETCPNLEWIGVVVTWFGDDLDAGICTIKPGVEYQTGAITSPETWSVAGFTRSTARQITLVDGTPRYGGTPDDESVLRYLDSLISRGYKIMFYPMFFMDVANKPWRGRVTGSAADVAGFFTKSNGYNAFINHYATLVKDKVDAFVIGSELIGLTSVQDTSDNSFPAVDELVSLAATVKATVGSTVKVTYAADWSEYHHTSGGWYNLDPLWASANIDMVGIDSYFPLTDSPQSQLGYDIQQVIDGWTKGEGYDWFYSDASARTSTLGANPFATTSGSDIVTCSFTAHNLSVGQEVTFAGTAGNPGGISNGDIDGKRTIIATPSADTFTFKAGSSASSSTGGAGGSAVTIDKPTYFNGQAYAWKDIEWWWKNTHTNPDSNNTAWVPQSKKIWFTEYGFPSVDGATNQPNVFYDPDSQESFFPRQSRGRVDFRAQRMGLAGTEAKWKNSSMIERMFVWTWDARPYPYWPDLTSVWADGGLWKTGHWVEGKLGLSGLAAIVADLCERVGLTSSDYNVSALTDRVEGFVISERISAREAIEQLMAGFFFDAVESDYILKFVPCGGSSVATIGESKLIPYAAYAGDNGNSSGDGEMQEALIVTRQQEIELPQKVNVLYFNRSTNYQIGNQIAQRQVTTSREVHMLSLPIVFADQLAKIIADVTLFNSWMERSSYSFILPVEYADLEPTDIVQVSAGSSTHTIRITDIQMGTAGALRVSGVAEDISVYDFYTPAGEVAATTADNELIPQTRLELLDIPAMPSDAADKGMLRVAAAGLSAGWRGAIIYRSGDGGSSYERYLDADSAAVIGNALDVLADGTTTVFDNKNTVTVSLTGQGQLASTSELAVLNGANVALLGSELLQFTTATLIASGKYTLSGLLRGRMGTEHATASHIAGERFVLLDGALVKDVIPPQLVGLSREYKPVTLGSTLGATTAQSFTYSGVALKPYSPVHISGTRDGSGNLTISWIRRNRLDGQWRDFIDIPLAEANEAYEVDILNGSTVVRTLTATTPTASYSAAQQTSDFGSTQSSVSVVVYQMSALIGRGYGGSATV